MWWSNQPYVSISKRRAAALREVQKLARNGRTVSPVRVAGRLIANTFWGKAWCDNLESYSDFDNRLPRGRSYVRNDSVVDLQIEAGKVTSLVSGSNLYRVTIRIDPLAGSSWKKIKTECGGQIGSLVELLQGRISQKVMEIVTRHGGGLFPSPGEIEMSCSCPDWAEMCKHVAATLYGVGNRLDHEPELLFKLRGADHLELIAQAGSPVAEPKSTKKTIAADRLADVFGIELETPSAQPAPAPSTGTGRLRKRVPARSKRTKRNSMAETKRKKPAAGRNSARGGSASAAASPRKSRARRAKDGYQTSNA